MRVFFLLDCRNATGPPSDQPARISTTPRSDRSRRAIWQAVRNRQIDGFKFRFQHSLLPFVADFACLEAMLIVELDGGQHDEKRDAGRTAFLEAQGFEVLRFWNNDVLGNLAGVIDVLRDALIRRMAEKK